jgi:sarcosine oxidase
LEHEVLDSSQVAQRFPGYRLPPSFQTLYEPEGGLLVPEKCIEVHLRLAQQQGAQLLCGTQVLGWQVLPPGAEAFEGGDGGSGGEASSSGSGSGEKGVVRVHTSRGSFTTRRLVLAGGGWMPQLVPELKVGARMLVQVQATAARNPQHKQPPGSKYLSAPGCN